MVLHTIIFFRHCEMLAMEAFCHSPNQPKFMLVLMICFLANICAPLNGEQLALQKEGMLSKTKPKKSVYPILR